MHDALNTTDNHQPLLYGELAEWFSLLTPVADYAEEAAFYRGLFEVHGARQPQSLLDLGSGGGHNAAHLKASLACTLVDRAPEMLAVSRGLNPECAHICGDMRTIRLGRQFDCVLVHDAVSYMASRADLAAAIATAYAHTAASGVALFHPDFVAETFSPGTDTGGSEDGGRALRYLEWRWIPEGIEEGYVTDMAYLLRHADGTVGARHDRHRMGLFPRAVWLTLIAEAGFDVQAVPFVHSSGACAGHEVFVGVRPDDEEGAES